MNSTYLYNCQSNNIFLSYINYNMYYNSFEKWKYLWFYLSYRCLLYLSQSKHITITNTRNQVISEFLILIYNLILIICQLKWEATYTRGSLTEISNINRQFHGWQWQTTVHKIQHRMIKTKSKNNPCKNLWWSHLLQKG